MGTWDTSIENNDTYLDVHSAFMERYHSGDEPRKITQDILSKYSEYFNDTDDKNNALFGLAKAQWETKALDKETFEKVKDVIDNGSDLKLWKELGATDDLIKKRKDTLNKFLETISTEREEAKRRIKKKFEFEKREILKLISPDKKKTLDIGEEFGDKKYIHTSGLLMWDNGGGSILYFSPSNQNISAQWINNAILEITHDKNIVFSKKEEKLFFMGDEVIIKYRVK
jgi:hypothetical protein